MRMMRKNEWSGENCKKKKKLEIHTTLLHTTQTNAYVFKKIHQNNCKRRHIYIRF